ncbi:hypothetical protein GALMADRAFT_208062 [Galerina marginata CBS 339.88]|uniref:F-box domain-containing protein n=1 Tax=Galerina marginata (strain CBS 339.88) TaxID=685588 RepID=A0A067TMY1_GALM3|nr:hypothetical protein GALMADRAFT_208062 [Galerina marginata CBS 339.88]
MSIESERTMKKNLLFLPFLANELLDKIVRDLGLSDGLSLMQTCWMFHDIVARVLYRVVAVSENDARRFFKTVAESKQHYGQYARALSYMATSQMDVGLTYFLLCAAIPKMEYLRHLNLTVRSDLSPFLLHQFRTHSVIRSALYSNGDPSSRVLPNLQKFTLHGDLALMDVVWHRTITSISITLPMSESSFTLFLDMATDELKTNPLLRELGLVLRHSMGAKIVTHLNRVGFAFPNLRTLVVKIPSANALGITASFAQSPPAFPCLRSFSLNNWSILCPIFVIAEDEALAQQGSHIVKAGEIMQDLESLAFGTVRWSRKTYSSPWVVWKTPEYDIDDENLPRDFFDMPVFWDVVYHDPSRPLSNTV